MMKFILMVISLNLFMVKNKMLMFYYNIYYFGSFMLIFMFMFKNNMYISVSEWLGNEYFSIWLIILSFWIIGVMMMSLEMLNLIKLMVINSLLLILIIFFLSLDLMIFYLMFEVSLIPTFFLILYWGSNLERLSASYYLMLYMLFISFPLLFYIFKIYMYSHSFSFMIVMMKMSLVTISFWGYMMIYMAFYIKMPIFFFHIWLPKAHVEAPVYGSMILAGVLLKMGSYGLVRLMMMFIKSSIFYSYMILSVSVVGSFLLSMVCLVQIDMKSLVAYSSVVHMNVMLGTLFTLFKLGIFGSYIMMIAHGLCSSGMFYMVNFYYVRTSSRLLILNKGMMDKIVMMSMWWFLLCVINFSYPFSINFISEMMMLGVLVNWDYLMIVYMGLICFFSSGYSLYLFSYIQHGESFMEMNFGSGTLKEYMILFIHIYPLIFMLLNLLMFM